MPRKISATKVRGQSPPRRVAALASDEEKDVSRRVPLFVDPLDVNPLGGVQSNEISAVALAPLPEMPEIDAPEFNIAFEAVAAVISTRAENAAAATDPKRRAVFIVTDRPRELGEAANAGHELFLNNGSRQLVGNIWITGPSMSSGYYIELSGDTSEDLRSDLVGRGFEKVSAFVFDPTATEPELRYYPYGVGEPDAVHRFSVAISTFSVTALDRIISDFYEDSLKTPDASGTEFTLWGKSSAYVPRVRTEVFIQGWLRSILKARLRSCEIRAEIPTDEGRADLMIVSRSTAPYSWIYHAVLELKVLRSLTSTKAPVSSRQRAQAISDGLLQAIAYQKKLSPTIAMLCCFDMTKPEHSVGEGCFAPIRKKADACSVQLRHYRIFGSSKDARQSQYGRKPTRASRARKHKKRL